MQNNEVFIEKYKQLENIIERKYSLQTGQSPFVYIERLSQFSKYRDKIQYCREVRNFLQHEPKINNSFAIYASDEMINLLDELINIITNPKRCKDVCIKINDIFYKGLNNSVSESMLQMSHGKYYHIPILENQILKGVFSSNSLFEYIIKERKFSLDKNLKFIDIIDYIDIKGNTSERYYFMKYNDLAEKAKEIFEENYKKANRVSIIFLTDNGKSNEKVKGMITLYDVID